MEVFAKLEQILSSHSQSEKSPAAVLAEEGSPTTSIAILDKGEIFSQCLSTEGNNEETLFQACSISKPVAGVAMAILVQQGKAKFDDKIVDILPQSVIKSIETPSTKHLVGEITIKMLMSHSSGLSVHGFPGYVDNIPSQHEILRGRAGTNTKQVRLNGLPGQRFSYSGGGITVLQLIMEHIAQKPLPDIVQELVLTPLGMHRSFYDLAETDGNAARAYYTGYTPCEVAYRTNPEQAAAGLWTTPTDLLKLVRGLQRSLKRDDGSSILQRDVAQHLLTEVKSNMALTWFAPQDAGIVFAHAGGNEPGWRCMLVGYADLHFSNLRPQGEDWSELFTDCGIAVMTNSASGFDVCWKVLNAMAHIKGWSAVPDMYGKPEVTVPFAALDRSLHLAWEHWIGHWSGGWKIAKDEDGFGIVIFEHLPPVRLIAAAMPIVKYADEVPMDVLLEGLEIVLRLSTDAEGRFIQVCDGGNGQITVIRPLE